MKFYWVRDEFNHPLAVIASTLDRETMKVKFTLAVHNPKDRFDRKRGREIAEGRLTKGKDVKEVPFKENTRELIMEALRDDVGLPIRVRDAAGAWLYHEHYDD